MKKIFLLLFFTSIAGITFFLSCKKEYSCENCNDKNKPPIANAGRDTIIVLPVDSVKLDGSLSSDPDGTITGFLWTKISGPSSFAINSATTARTTVNNIIAGVYQFELKVTDNDGLSAKDTMNVIVDSVMTTNHSPIANAGADQTITLPTNTINLDGSGSTDPDNNIANYLWAKISGPSSFNISNANTVQTQVTNLVQGIYLFELKVTDAGGLFTRDTMQVIVNAATSNNLPPVAIAGNDTTIQTNQTSCAPVSITITLSGIHSYDPDGTIVSYLWSGPGTISNPNSAITTVNGLFQGTVLFILKVTDNDGAFAFDTVRILIIPENRPLVQAQLIPIGTLSVPRLGMSIASAGNKLLFAGGFELGQFNSVGGVAFSRVDIYDLVTNNWSTAELSMERANMGVAVAGNKIFFAGGQDYNDTWLNVQYKRIDIYDASTGSWSIDSLSWERVSPAGEAIGNKVFFGGGLDAYITTGHGNIVDIKDLSTNSWSATTLSEEKAYLSSEVIGDKIYFAGGAHGYYFSVPSDEIDIYDNTMASWSSEHMLEPKTHFASIGFAGKIYWAGGWTGLSPATQYISNLVEIKDITTNTSTHACLFQPNASFDAVLKNNKIVFFTGNATEQNKFDIYDPATGVWSIGILPVNIDEAAILSVNNTIYVAGGYVNGVLSNQVWKLEF